MGSPGYVLPFCRVYGLKLEINVCMIAWDKRLHQFLIGYKFRFHYYIMWSNSKMIKTYQLSMKQITQQRGRKRYKMEGHKSWQTKNTTKRIDCKGNNKKSSTWTLPPPIEKSILNKGEGRTNKRMSNVDEPSPIIITHLKIKVVYTRYNATNTLCMQNEGKTLIT
jgi:hypothetical protein